MYTVDGIGLALFFQLGADYTTVNFKGEGSVVRLVE
jgi:hypothetical protein